MRRASVFLAALLLGALTVGGDEESDRALLDQIERLSEVLRRRAAVAPRAGTLVETRLYDVSDLCSPVEDADLTETTLRGSSLEPDPAEPRPPYEVDVIVDILRSTVDPPSWECVEGAEIHSRGHILDIRQSPAVHARIEGRLRQLREYVDAFVAVEIAAVEVDAGQATAVESRARELEPAEADLLRAGKRLGTARLVCFDGQQVVARNGRERSVLADYDVEIAQSATVGCPVRVSLFEGCAAEVRAILDRAADAAMLQMRLEWTRLAEPIRTLATEHGPVDLPELMVSRVQSSIWVPLGVPVVAGGCTVGERTCLFLVEARRLRAAGR